MAKTAKTKTPKEPKETKAPAAGHNSMTVPEVVAAKDEWLDLDLKQKELGKAKREIGARMKDRFSIPKGNWNEEMKKQKMARDARIQFEAQAHDLKGMLGYQASLDLQEGTVPRTEEEYLDPAVQARQLITKTA